MLGSSVRIVTEELGFRAATNSRICVSLKITLGQNEAVAPRNCGSRFLGSEGNRSSNEVVAGIFSAEEGHKLFGHLWSNFATTGVVYGLN
jgi:hypothetical protein